MPRFDGTGPRGQGPMAGRGEGYCAIKLPESDQAPEGYAGVQGTPVRLDTPAALPGGCVRRRGLGARSDVQAEDEAGGLAGGREASRATRYLKPDHANARR